MLLKELRKEGQPDMLIYFTIINANIKFYILHFWEFSRPWYAHYTTSILVNFFKMNLLEEKGWGQNFYYGTHLLAHIFADICFVTCQVLKLSMRVRNEKTTKEL